MGIARYVRWRLSPAGKAAYKSYAQAREPQVRTRAQGPLRVTGTVARVAARQQAEDLAAARAARSPRAR